MKILRNLDLNNVVFIDIETAQIVPKLEKDTPLYDSWEYKMKHSKDIVEKGEKTYEQLFDEQAQLYPEFAKVICITIGKIQNEVLKLKSFYGDDEHKLLKEFNTTITNIVASNKNSTLCGHYIIGFDIPFIMTRSIINGIEPASLIDIAHLKPWEVTCIDTHNLWKGTSSRSASLINIAVALGLPSPKDTMFGYESSKVYYNEPDGLGRIERYCRKDVLTVANIVRKCRFEQPVPLEDSEIDVRRVGSLERVFNSKKITKEEEQNFMKIVKDLPEDEQKAATDILTVAIPKEK